MVSDHKHTPHWQAILITGISFYLSAEAGMVFRYADITSSAFWPASGVGLFCMIIFGRVSLIGILLGAYALNFKEGLNEWSWTLTTFIGPPLLYSVTSVIEAIIEKKLYNRWIKNHDLFDDYITGANFFILAMLGSSVSAIVGTVCIQVFYEQVVSDAKIIFLTWWLGNATGVLLITPLLLSIKQKKGFTFSGFSSYDVIFVGVIGLITYILGSTENYIDSLTYSTPILAISVTFLICFRLSPQIALIFLFFAALTSMLMLKYGTGPLVALGEFNSLVLHQVFIVTIASSLTIIGGALNEIQTAKQRLETFNENLEDMVKQGTQKIQETNRHLLKVNKELDRFVYSVSHELRAPIASSLGLINLAKIEQDQDRIMEYIDIQEKSMKKLDSFLKEILDYSRNNQSNLSHREFYLYDMVEDIIDHYSADIKKRNIAVKINLRKDTVLNSDESRLNIVLRSVIHNAINFYDGQKAQPHINISTEQTREHIKINIADNGLGIRKDCLPHIFDMFYRATDEVSTGPGLGLYIVKEIIDKLTGEVEATSEEGIGTTISITVPLNN
jgi:signal transduction histidine kinase